ncbi:hypothetical protein ACFY3U_15560 [Micromonospora sp. NPDC000089]|uniref:hypothetical protein n=1 Tax=unclassified Micromonospora TaxID=2617518 RepID=UPI0036A0AB52
MGMPDAEGHGPPEGLPDLPPEWGRVVVPDDASELAAEAEQLRRELHGSARPGRRRRLSWLLTGPDGRLPAGLPVLIMLVALFTTLGGLAAVTWPRPLRVADRPTVVPNPAEPTPLAGRPLPALDLIDADQTPVPLRGLLPTMIILLDACACAEQVGAAAAAAPAGVQVVTVSGRRTVGDTPTAAARVRPLADPAGGLRAALRLAPRPGTAPALLVDRDGTVIRVLPALGAADDYRADLARLAG